MRSRVMPGSLVTMERRVPVKRLKSVDLPTLGRPRITRDGSSVVMKLGGDAVLHSTASRRGPKEADGFAPQNFCEQDGRGAPRSKAKAKVERSAADGHPCKYEITVFSGAILRR